MNNYTILLKNYTISLLFNILFPEFIADDERLKYVDENWNKLAPHLLDFNYTVPVEKHEEVAQTIRRHYFGTKSIDRSTVGQFVKALGDRTFVIDAEKAARMQAKVNKSPVWFFYFSYRGAHSLSEVATRTNVNYGTFFVILFLFHLIRIFFNSSFFI